MGVIERREREREEMRRKILDAARDLFATEGYERITMRRSPTRSSTPPTTIYNHFEDKDDLVHALCEDGLPRLFHHLAGDAAARGSGGGGPPARPRLRPLRRVLPEPLPVHVHDAAASSKLSEIRTGPPVSEAFGLLRDAVDGGHRGRLLPPRRRRHRGPGALGQHAWGDRAPDHAAAAHWPHGAGRARPRGAGRGRDHPRPPGRAARARAARADMVSLARQEPSPRQAPLPHHRRPASPSR